MRRIRVQTGYLQMIPPVQITKTASKVGIFKGEHRVEADACKNRFVLDVFYGM
jgi:hypothetical protein